MRIITSKSQKTHDEKAYLTGFIEVECLSFYDKGEFMPSVGNGVDSPKQPCLMLEKFDHENSTQELSVLVPVEFISLTEEQAEFFRRNFQKEQE